MNKPIRTISIFCLLLFLALMLNATYLQYCEGRRAQRRPAQPAACIDAAYSRERGADPGRRATPVAQSVPIERPATSTSAPTRSRASTPRSPATSPDLRRDRHRAVAERRALRRRLAAVRQPARRPAQQRRRPRAAASQLTIDPTAQTGGVQRAAARSARTSQGAVVALEPRPARSWRWSPPPTYDPNRLASPRPRPGAASAYDAADATTRRSRCSTGRSSRRYPPGSTFKLVTAAAALESGKYTPTSQVPGGATLDLPQTEPRPAQRERLRLRRRPDHADPGARGLLQRRVRRLGAQARRRRAARRRPRSSASTSTYLDDLDAAGDQPLPDATPDAPQTGAVAIGQYDVRGHAAADGDGRRPAIANGGTVMKPYLVDEVQSPRPVDVLDKTEPEALCSSAVSPPTARELTQMMVDVVEQRHRPHRADPGHQGRRQDRHRAERAAAGRRTPGSCRSRPADDPQGRRRGAGRGRAASRAARSPAAAWPAPIAKAVMEAVIGK